MHPLLVQALRRFALVHDHEVVPLANSFACLFCLLASYFIVVPLREDAGLSLGMDALPKLFTASLIGVLVLTPLASSFLARPGLNREASLRQFYAVLATVLLGFYVVYYASSLETAKMFPGLDRSSKEAPPAPMTVKGGDPSLDAFQRAVRAAFYVFLNVQNLVAISAAWARCADVFAPEAAARLFGVVSAGATVGQLAGSLVTAGVAGARVGTPASGPLYGLVLASALLMYGAAFFAAKVQRPAARRLADPPGAVAGDAAGHPGSAALDKDAPSGGATAHVAQLLQGFTMIARSPYLLMVCGYLMMTYIVGSLMYFQRSLVVATAVADSNARAAFFARLHSASAAAIICLQLTATGRLLRSAGVMFALAVFPCACAVLVAAVGWRPDTGVVALGEVARKLLGYVLVRPAREVLFTAVSREEKYRAKLTIDAVVQRLGDSLAALLFEVLDVRLQLGQHGVAAAGVAACMLWLYWSVQLGAQHTALTSGAGSVSVAQERRDFGGQEQAGPTAALTGRV